MRSPVIILVCLLASALARAADGWQRIVCIDDPKVTVTLLLKAEASPADEEFVGFELHNRTDAPLRLQNMTGYRLDQVRTADRETGKPLSHTSMASGNSYDLLWRDGIRPPEGPRDDSIAPGITRRAGYASAYSFAILGWPTGKGWTIEGRAHVTLGLPGNLSLQTPRAGVPFKFAWLQADQQGIDALRNRLQRTLTQPADQFYTAYLLGVLLKREEVASAASVEDMLAGWKRADTVVRPTIRQFIDAKFAGTEPVVAFALEAIRSRDPQMLEELAATSQLRDVRLIEPLLAWMRDNPPPPHMPALQMLKRHRDLMRDRRAVSAELGRIVLSRSSLLAKGEFPDRGGPIHLWEWQVNELALTGDPAMVPHLLPYLARTDVIVDARRTAMMNNGVSERACDRVYNAILDLLERPDERFSMSERGLGRGDGLTPEQEYARRDALIQRLKAEFTAPAKPVPGAGAS